MRGEGRKEGRQGLMGVVVIFDAATSVGLGSGVCQMTYVGDD